MNILQAIYNGILAFVDWIWGVPVLIVLIGGGIVLSIFIGNIQFTKFGYIMKHTFGTFLHRKTENEDRKKGITSLQAVTAALGGTIGTGNIVGVSSAILMGGPGALFWMWVCGFVAMAIKYCEVLLGVKYRQKNERTGNYLGGPFVYIKYGLHCNVLAYIMTAFLLAATIITAAVHSSTFTSAMTSVGVSTWVSALICVLVCVTIVFGGMKWLVKMTDKMVPFMTIFYIVCALIVIFANIGKIGSVFAEIFVGAFTGHAALGGFVGSTVIYTMRQGLARGVFSNDAGSSTQAILHAQAENISHPAEQAIWAVFETFIDTIIVCSMTGFMVLFSGVWTDGESEATLAATAMSTVLGTVGKYGCILALLLFTLSSMMAIAQIVPVQAIEIVGNPKIMHVLQGLFLVSIAAGCLTDVQSTFIIADLGNGLCLYVNMVCMILLGKVLHDSTKEYFSGQAKLEALARANKAK